jgi:hypothetical protein
VILDELAFLRPPPTLTDQSNLVLSASDHIRGEDAPGSYIKVRTEE